MSNSGKPKTGSVSFSSLGKGDNWSAEFCLSSAFQSLCELTPGEIIAEAQKKIDASSDYVLSKVSGALTSKKESPLRDNFDIDNAVTQSTKKRVGSAISSRTITDKSTVGVQVAVCIYSLISAAENSKTFADIAIEERDLLLRELAKVDAFINKSDTPDISSALGDEDIQENNPTPAP